MAEAKRKSRAAPRAGENATGGEVEQEDPAASPASAARPKARASDKAKKATSGAAARARKATSGATAKAGKATSGAATGASKATIGGATKASKARKSRAAAGGKPRAASHSLARDPAEPPGKAAASAGAAKPRASAEAAKPKSSAGAAKPRLRAAAANPKPSAAAAEPKSFAGAAKPKPSAAAAKPKVGAARSKPQVTAATAKAKRSATTAKPRRSAGAAPKPKPAPARAIGDAAATAPATEARPSPPAGAASEPTGQQPSAGPGRAEEAARKYFDAIVARDPDAVVAGWRSDGVDDIVPLGVFRGSQAVRTIFSEMFAAMPDFEMTVERIVADEKVAAVQWRLSGHFTGAPFQGIEPTGRRVELRGTDLVEVDEDGRIARNTGYYDGAAFARAIGMLPPQESGPERAMLAGFNAVTKLRRTIRSR